MRLVTVPFFVVYLNLAPINHPVLIANAKLRARTISREPFACVCIRVRGVCACTPACTCLQDREGLVAVAEDIINKLINVNNKQSCCINYKVKYSLINV